MSDEPKWEVRVTAPNGAEGRFVFAGDSDDDALVEQFSTFLASVADNDPVPDDPEKMIGPAQLNARKEVR